MFEGVPTFEVGRQDIEEGIKLADLLVDRAAVFPSKGEMRKLAQQGGLSINKEKGQRCLCPSISRHAAEREIHRLSRKAKKLLPACCKIKPTDKNRQGGYAFGKIPLSVYLSSIKSLQDPAERRWRTTSYSMTPAAPFSDDMPRT